MNILPCPLDTRARLDAAIHGLPPVKDGHKRVFRGQAELFDQVLASANRPGRPPYVRGQLLKTVAKLLLDEFRGSDPGGVHDYAVWTELVAQQYSNGSPFLDVTTRLDVAAWFALTDFKVHDHVAVFGDSGPFDPDVDFAARLPLLCPSRTARQEGHLLVFDLPVHADGLPRSHADLVDLESTPPGFYGSARIRNQSASLAYTSRRNNGGDLSPYLAAPPIRLSPRLLDDLDPEICSPFLFPTPDNDEWYRRLLQLPLWLHLHDDNHLELGQSFEVPLYAWDLASAETVTEPLIMIRPPLLTPVLRREVASDEGSAATLLGPDSISIVVEEPIFITSPKIDDASWDQEALWNGQPRVAAMKDEAGEASGEIDLSKVYFEFSPLELGDWRAAEIEGATFHAGAYLTRTETDLILQVVQRRFPEGAVMSQPLTFRFDQAVGRFCFIDNQGSSSDATDLGNPFKTLLVCLRLLIRLNSSPVADGIALVVNGLKANWLVGQFHLQRALFQGDPVYLLRRDDGSGHFLPNVLGPSVTAETGTDV